MAALPAVALREAPRPAPTPPPARRVDLSVVVPVLDEAENILPLVDEIRAVLEGERFEVVYVDDGSTDGTPARLAEAAARYPEVRVLAHDGRYGQSAAIRTGVRAALGPVIVTLDGDGQNDPVDIPALLEALRAAPGRVGLVAGHRTRRRDTPLRRLSSRVANSVRDRVLGDGVADTGCGLKAFVREAFLDLPYFDHMHRFLPALMQREGYEVRVVPVRHRPRRAGRSKYGVWNRLGAGLVDLAGVLWLMRRGRVPRVSTR